MSKALWRSGLVLAFLLVALPPLKGQEKTPAPLNLVPPAPKDCGKSNVVDVEIRMISAPSDIWKCLQAPKDHFKSPSHVVLDDLHVRLLLTAIQSDQRSRILHAPRLALSSGIQGQVRLIEEVVIVPGTPPVLTHVSTFPCNEVNVNAVPVGWEISVRPTVSPDRSQMQLDFTCAHRCVPPEPGQSYDSVQQLGSGQALLIHMGSRRGRDTPSESARPGTSVQHQGGSADVARNEGSGSYARYEDGARATLSSGCPILSRVSLLTRLVASAMRVFRGNQPAQQTEDRLILITPRLAQTPGSGPKGCRR